MTTVPQQLDRWTLDVATEAKELGATTAAILAQHREQDATNFASISKALETADRNRHDLRNDMLTGFGEMRGLHAKLASDTRADMAKAFEAMATVATESRAAVSAVTATMNSRFWSLSIAMIVFLVGVSASLIATVGYLVAHGISGIAP